MRPERLDGMNSLSAGNLRAIRAVLLASISILLGTARASVSPPQSPADKVYDTKSFLDELSRLRAGIEVARQSAERVQSLREALPETWTVQTGSRVYGVPTDLLASRLEKAEKQPGIRDQQLDEARNYLAALAAEVSSLSGQLTPRTDSARSKLDAILRRPEFAHSVQESWWNKLRERVYKFIFEALDRLVSRVGGQKSLGVAVLWIAICGAAIFIVYWIFRLWFRAAKVQEMALQAAAAPSRTWQEWIQAAREAAAHGDYRMAVHCAYWAGIARLQDLGALAPDRTKTPREYLRALAKSRLVMPDTLAGRQQALSLLTTRLEKIWYGFHPATEADFSDTLRQLEALGCHLP